MWTIWEVNTYFMVCPDYRSYGLSYNTMFAWKENTVRKMIPKFKIETSRKHLLWIRIYVVKQTVFMSVRLCHIVLTHLIGY